MITTNQYFGRLLTVKKLYPIGKYSRWVCNCSCGSTKIVAQSSLLSGRTISCGCYKKEAMRTNSLMLQQSHGHSTGRVTSTTYNCWAAMIQRCVNPKHKAFKDYGGRGITFDPQWHQFETFLIDMGEQPRGLQLDRIDNNKGYIKSNCQWTTPKNNSRNRRNNRYVTINGETKLLLDWAIESGINLGTLRNRLKRGWHESALLLPPYSKAKKTKELQ